MSTGTSITTGSSSLGTVPGQTGNGTSTVTLPDSGVDSIVVNTGDGNDTLTIEFTGGFNGLNDPVTFNGGDPALPTTPGDQLIISNGNFGAVATT